MKCNRDCFNCVYDDCIEGSFQQRYGDGDKLEHQRAYQRRKRAEALEKGLCGNCRKREATRGTLCEVCRQRTKVYRFHVNISKRIEKWTMDERTRPFVDALIRCGYSDSTVYRCRWAADDFFARFDALTPESLKVWGKRILENNKRKTALSKINALNRYCDFAGKPEWRIKVESKSRKRDDLQRLTNSNAAGASILEA